MSALTGTCMCGSVSWKYRAEVTRRLVCHCTDCQRATSSPITAFVGMRPEQLSWTGEIAHYESSPGTFRGFCPSCGTRLYFRSDRWPGEIHVHAATMSEPDAYEPDAQVFVPSKAKWLGRLESIPAYEEFHQRPAIVPGGKRSPRS